MVIDEKHEYLLILIGHEMPRRVKILHISLRHEKSCFVTVLTVLVVRNLVVHSFRRLKFRETSNIRDKMLECIGQKDADLNIGPADRVRSSYPHHPFNLPPSRAATASAWHERLRKAEEDYLAAAAANATSASPPSDTQSRGAGIRPQRNAGRAVRTGARGLEKAGATTQPGRGDRARVGADIDAMSCIGEDSRDLNWAVSLSNNNICILILAALNKRRRVFGVGQSSVGKITACLHNALPLILQC